MSSARCISTKTRKMTIRKSGSKSMVAETLLRHYLHSMIRSPCVKPMPKIPLEKWERNEDYEWDAYMQMNIMGENIGRKRPCRPLKHRMESNQ